MSFVFCFFLQSPVFPTPTRLSLALLGSRLLLSSRLLLGCRLFLGSRLGASFGRHLLFARRVMSSSSSPPSSAASPTTRLPPTSSCPGRGTAVIARIQAPSKRAVGAPPAAVTAMDSRVPAVFNAWASHSTPPMSNAPPPSTTRPTAPNPEPRSMPVGISKMAARVAEASAARTATRGSVPGGCVPRGRRATGVVDGR